MLPSWTHILTATNAKIVSWAEAESWTRAMAKCQQDPGWHAEGDVWTHTRMVCAELERLDEWSSLDRAAQLKLLFTALLHDAGKPKTTVLDPETGRMRSPKHAVVGAELARNVLRLLGCDLLTREEIVALVRYHGRPPYLLEKEKPEHEVISLSWFLNNHLLYLFALADTRGRRTADMARPEENLHLWKLLCEEHNCLYRPYPFVNDQARFLFYRDQLSSLYYTPHEDYRCTVTMMSGLPGAGKDTWLGAHKSDLPVVSLDAVRAELEIDPTDNQGEVIQAARERCREHLRAGRNFAFNATNTTRLIRKRWIDLFADYSARIEIIYIEPPVATIFDQNKQRGNPVPTGVIMRLLEKLEPPTLAEAHHLHFTDGQLP
jgi:putative nucleotidyltransferase with HDIG domain